MKHSINEYAWIYFVIALFLFFLVGCSPAFPQERARQSYDICIRNATMENGEFSSLDADKAKLCHQFYIEQLKALENVRDNSSVASPLHP